MPERYDIDESTTFVNPYNFVPLDESCNKELDYREQKKKGKLTGWLNCTLKTRTSIFVPNTTKEFTKRINNSDVKSLEFYSYENLSDIASESFPELSPVIPVVPGSEMRGMIRTAYEAVTNSCMSTLENEKILYKRTVLPGMPGILKYEKDEWRIYKCRKYMLKLYACDKDPYHSVRRKITDEEWQVMAQKTFRDEQMGRTRNYFFYNRNNQKYLMAYKEIQKYNKKISLMDDRYLVYHTKMTNDEKKTLEEFFDFNPMMNRVIDDLYNLSKTLNYSEDDLDRRDGKIVWVKIGDFYDNRRRYLGKVISDLSFSKKTGNGWKNGYLLVGEHIDRKHHCSVFISVDEVVDLGIENETAIFNLIDNLKLYKDKSINIHLKNGEHSGYNNLINSDTLNVTALSDMPVYYTTKDGRYYLSPATIGREVFHNKLAKIIDKHKPCNNLEKLCPACALFGLAADKNSAASRVRFTDAFCEGTPSFENAITLQELASPKISATEFYLKRQSEDHDMWNYDYAGQWVRNDNGKWEFSCFYNYFPEIRGRKFYWHQKDADYIEKLENISDRNVHVRPLKKNNIFSFKVFFNNITEDELNTLIWVLEIGGSTKHAHKMGMGKPIGLGSVQISIGDICIRRLVDNDNTTRYWIENKSKSDFAQVKKLLTDNDQILMQFMMITNFEQAPENVCYPFTTDLQGNREKETYKWFVENRKFNTSQMRPKINQPLPEVKESVSELQKLSSYKKIE